MADRKVVGYRNPDGSANLSGCNLPVHRVAAASGHIDALAKAVKRAGDGRPIDHIRADLFLGMTDGTYSGLDDAEIVNQLLVADDVGESGDPSDHHHHDDARSGAAPLAALGGSGPVVPGGAGMELRVRLSTLLGQDQYPAELAGWGPVHAELARELATTLGGAEWRFVITDEQGQLRHCGITRSRPTGTPTRMAGCPAIVELAVPATTLHALREDLAGLGGWAEVVADLLRQMERGTAGDGDEGRRAAEPPPVPPRAEWVTSLSMEEIARPLGARLPVWIRGTLTEPYISRSLAYNDTFTVPDGTTGWLEAQQRVEHAVKIGLPEQYPAAWAVLAVDAKDRLDAIREAHAETPDTGPGWYLVARPAPPQVPVGLESRLNAAALEDPAQAVADLVALREAAADLEVDDQVGEVYTEAIALLSLQLKRQANHQRRGRVFSSVTVAELDAVLDQTLVSFSAPWAGPVIDEWKATLTWVENAAVALRQRRVVDLLGGNEPVDPSTVDVVYRDRDGRYVVVFPSRGDNPPSFVAEWPASLDAVTAWNDRTVLAADHAHQATAILALTPTDDGQMRVDPLPLRGHRACGNAFAYGYNGGTPATTYNAILRCALPAQHQLIDLRQYRMRNHDGESPRSQLWEAIATTKGPLRLHWSDVQQWARIDLATAKAAARPKRAER